MCVATDYCIVCISEPSGLGERLATGLPIETPTPSTLPASHQSASLALCGGGTSILCLPFCNGRASPLTTGGFRCGSLQYMRQHCRLAIPELHVLRSLGLSI